MDVSIQEKLSNSLQFVCLWNELTLENLELP